MNMLKFSVIVPVYNIGRFLRECLESLCNQTLDDFEAIVVDDGSVDSSAEICKEYAERDSRVKFFHKENGGVSSALNMGLRYATGKYLCFVDGDDWIDLNTLEFIYKFFEENADVDVYGFNCVFETENGSNRNIPLTVGEFAEARKDALMMATIHPKFIERKYKLSLPGIRSKCVKAFRADLIRKNNIQFNENIPIGEDALFCSECLFFARKYSQGNNFFYHYRIYQQSCNRKYRSQWDYVFERIKCMSALPAFTQKKDYKCVLLAYAFGSLKRIMQTYLLHENNRMKFSEKVAFVKNYTSNNLFPKISIPLDVFRFLPEYLPFLFIIRWKMFRTLLIVGNLFKYFFRR